MRAPSASSTTGTNRSTEQRASHAFFRGSRSPARNDHRLARPAARTGPPAPANPQCAPRRRTWPVALEHLRRYITRSAIANARLSRNGKGEVVPGCKSLRREGSRHRAMAAREFMRTCSCACSTSTSNTARSVAATRRSLPRSKRSLWSSVSSRPGFACPPAAAQSANTPAALITGAHRAASARKYAAKPSGPERAAGTGCTPNSSRRFR
jgi:hypothetical protein